jgi:hypothetical protein
VSEAPEWNRFQRAYVAGALGSMDPTVVSAADLSAAARLARARRDLSPQEDRHGRHIHRWDELDEGGQARAMVEALPWLWAARHAGLISR